MYLLSRWFVSAFSLLAATYVIPGITISSFYTALIVALILGFLNAIVRPILFFLTLPITIMTLGLFVLVLNGLIFWFVASFIKGFEVAGFWSAVGGAFIVTVVSWFGNRFLKSAYADDPRM